MELASSPFVCDERLLDPLVPGADASTDVCVKGKDSTESALEGQWLEGYQWNVTAPHVPEVDHIGPLVPLEKLDEGMCLHHIFVSPLFPRNTMCCTLYM